MKITYEMGGITSTLEIDLNKIFTSMSEEEKALLSYVIETNLTDVNTLYCRVLRVMILSGPLSVILLPKLLEKIAEANEHSMEVLQENKTLGDMLDTLLNELNRQVDALETNLPKPDISQ